MKSGNMKFWSFTLPMFFCLNISWGQEIAEKKTQAGLTGTFGLNLLKMGTNKMNKNGVGTDLGVGVILHSAFKNSKNLGLAYGLEFEFGSFKFKPEENTYYSYDDKNILTKDDTRSLKEDTSDFLLQERTQKPVYVTIPIMFLFRTDFIGDFRYFGKFGIRNSFLVSNKMNDSGIDMNSKSTMEFSNMRSSGETFFYNGSIGLTAGAEWNFIGSTSLVGELGYFYGITPLFLDRRDANKSLFSYDESGARSYFSNNANLNQILLKISILF
jgi:hypothetical protein